MLNRVLMAGMAALAVGVFYSPSSLACSFAGLVPFEIRHDPGDTTPPAAVDVDVEIARGKAPRDNGDGTMTATSCDDLGTVALSIRGLADEQLEDMGLRLRVVGGELPEGAQIPDEPVELGPYPVVISWIDGAADEQEPVDFTLTIAAVDRSGNEGPATEVHVFDPGSSAAAGCQLAGGANGWDLSLIAPVALWLAYRRRQARQPR